MSAARFTRIESRRLILRPFTDSDLATFLAYRNDPKVARYQSWDSCSREEAIAFIREMKTSRPGMPGEWFQFAVELKEGGALVGDCALKVDEDNRYQAEIGFTLSREHQGQGYASEAVARLLDYAFGDLGLHRVVAIAYCENERSVALLERLGMRREGRLLHSARFERGWADEYVYAILGNEWPTERSEDDVPELRITSEPHAGEQDAAFIREALALHNVAVTQDAYYSPLAIFLRDERGAILGGVLGDVWGGWLDLTFLWVTKPLRGQGYGKKLLEAAEEEARAHGCRGVHTSTHSFQARPFYEKFGYEVVGEIPDNPAGHSLFYLTKMLAEG